MGKNIDIVINSMRYPESENDKNLIEKFSLKIDEGDFISILGPSGSGKTTLLRIIANLEKRYSGSIKLNNKIIKNPSKSVQVVFQNNLLIPWKTVLGNILFPLNNNNTKKEVYKWLNHVGLTGKENRWPKTLSGGEESRVAFARVFVEKPEILLLDEPFRNVDLEIRYQLQKVLQNFLIENKITTILVSHSIEDAVMLSDKIYLFKESPLNNAIVYEVPFSKPRDLSNPKIQKMISTIVKEVINSKTCDD